MKDPKECPKCGNVKHQEVISIETESGEESRLFKCKSCGYTEYMFPEFQKVDEKKALDRMGDAFRDYLKEKKQR